MKILLITAVLIALGHPATCDAEGTIDRAAMKQVLERQQGDNYYVKLLTRRSVSEVVFSEIKTKYFRTVSIYMCIIPEPGLHRRDFLFFLDPSGAAHVLTESNAGLTVLMKSIPPIDFGKIDAELFIREVAECFSPKYSNVVIVNPDNLQNLNKRHNIELELGTGEGACVFDGGSVLLGSPVVMVDDDLVFWNIEAVSSKILRVGEVFRVRNFFNK